jgi:hypothetical protein
MGLFCWFMQVPGAMCVGKTLGLAKKDSGGLLPQGLLV